MDGTNLIGGAGSRLPTSVLSLTGLSTLVAVLVSMMSIWLQLKNYRKPFCRAINAISGRFLNGHGVAGRALDYSAALQNDLANLALRGEWPWKMAVRHGEKAAVPDDAAPKRFRPNSGGSR